MHSTPLATSTTSSLDTLTRAMNCGDKLPTLKRGEAWSNGSGNYHSLHALERAVELARDTQVS